MNRGGTRGKLGRQTELVQCLGKSRCDLGWGGGSRDGGKYTWWVEMTWFADELDWLR